MVFEFAMSEWGIAPEAVVFGWSWRKLFWMMEQLKARRERERKALDEAMGKGGGNESAEEVGADEFMEWFNS